MAYSKTPVNSTYTTKQVPLLRELNSRGSDTAKDEYCNNMYFELVQNKNTQENIAEAIKRIGSTSFIASLGVVRGGYLWKDTNRLYLAIGASIYSFNPETGALLATMTGAIGGGTGYVGFTEYQYVNTTIKLVVTDGTTLSTIDSSNVVVTNTDPDMPIHEPYPVVIDGFLLVLKTNSADVYNADDDNPLSWGNANFITAEMRADTAKRIALLNNYLLVFGSKSIEYFYDAANATGSPFSRNDSPVKSVGYIGGLAQQGNKIYFIGETSEGNPQVFVLEDFKITPVSTEAISRHLRTVTNNTIQANIVSMSGHDFYVMYTGPATYVMDMENMLWSKWTYQDQTVFPMTFSFPHYSTTGYRNLFIINTTQAVHRFDHTLFQDNGIAYPVIWVGDNELFDSFNRKSMHRLVIWADKPPSSASILVQWSDDDYQTYNAGQNLELFQDLPCIYRMGQFRRRVLKLTYTANHSLRLYKIEVDLNLGNS